MLKNDNDDLISSGAIEILQKQNQNKISRERAFNLLERVLFFKHTILFHTISAEKLLRLVEVARQVEYKEGEEISTTGKVSDQLYIVKSGCIRVEKIAADNKISVIFVNQGETYGEVGLFSKAIRKSTAIAHTRTELFVIKGADMKRLIREIPDIAFNLLEVISGRLLESGYTVENKNTG
jgi:CRP/FNR family transcriptional regulator